VRIAVSSSSFSQPLTSGALTQLEWIAQCATVLGADGIVAALDDFPRTDAEYVAQLRKVAIDLGLVPLGIDAPALLALPADAERCDAVLTLARELGTLLVRTQLPAPGPVPPATFIDTVQAAKAASRAAKRVNVTLVVVAVAGTLGADVAGLKHLLKDVDSAWLRTCPTAREAAALGPKERIPAYVACAGDDPGPVVAAASRGWLILDAPAAERPWDELGAAVSALRAAEAEAVLGALRGSPG
jgi:hypothetical protein